MTALLIVAAGAVLAVAVLIPPATVHPVTGPMRAAAGAMSGRRVTSLAAVGSDGRRHAPADEATGRPLVLIFIQDGCPCSEAADPFLRRLHTAYGQRAAFLGVIDGDLAVARDWASRHASPYPILADPGRRLIAACRAKRSAYVLLVAPGGTVENLWPGYSTAMLNDLGAALARMTGQDKVAIDVKGAPEAMASGCPF